MRQVFDISTWKGRPEEWPYGNQRKWTENGLWYKEDFPDRPEAAGEYLVSQILRSSNVSCFADYDLVTSERNGTKAHICVSKDFLTNGIAIEELSKTEKKHLPQLLPVYDILGEHYGEYDKACKNRVGWWGIYNRFTKHMSNKELIQNFVSVIEAETGLKDFGGYITMLCELDAITRNIDRHLSNICVVYLRDEHKYLYCPVFDNGASFSATTHYDFNTMTDPDIALFSRLKPYGLFGKDFEKTVKCCHELYGPRLQILKSLDMEPAFAKVEQLYDKNTAVKMRKVWNRAKGLHKDFFVDEITRRPVKKEPRDICRNIR